MQAITPYINLNGRAEEALNFYSEAFGGGIEHMQKYEDAPQMPGSEAMKGKVMHGIFRSGDLNFMISAVPEAKDATMGTNTSLSLNFDQVADIDRVFDKMSEGANIVMPLQDTFWGAKFGILTDKFGINWMFNHDYIKKEN